MRDPGPDLHGFVDAWLGPLQRRKSQGTAAMPLITTIKALIGRDLDGPDLHVVITPVLRARSLLTSAHWSFGQAGVGRATPTAIAP